MTIDVGGIPENGGQAVGTVTRNTGTNGNLVFTLVSSDLTEATVPTTVVIPDGSDSTTFDITASANGFEDGVNRINVTEGGVTIGTVELLVNGNTGGAGASLRPYADGALVPLEVSGEMVYEALITAEKVPGAGLGGQDELQTVVFQVPDLLDMSMIGVELVDSSPGPNGQKRALLVYEEKAAGETLDISSSLYDCYDRPPEQDPAGQTEMRWAGQLVLDVTGLQETLTLSLDQSTISELGGSATATIARNTGTIGALTVTIGVNDGSELTVLTTVTIPNMVGWRSDFRYR